MPDTARQTFVGMQTQDLVAYSLVANRLRELGLTVRFLFLQCRPNCHIDLEGVRNGRYRKEETKNTG